MYNKKVMEHFLHPRNTGVIKNADGIGKAGNILCGDVMWIYIKVERRGKKLIIKDIKFKTFGCAAAIASSSMLTQLAKGKSFEEVLKITKQDVVDSLGGLPPIKIHCSLLATDAVREAMYDYLSKNKLPIPKELIKTHEKVEKEMELAKKRYEEFIKTREQFAEVT